MDPDLPYLLALAEARSCLAALADGAGHIRAAAYFDRVLLYLDVITGDVGSATYPIEADSDVLLCGLARSLDRMLRSGADPGPLRVIFMLAVRPMGED